MLLPVALTLGLIPSQATTPPQAPKTPPDQHAPTVSPKKSENPSDANAAIIKEFVRRVTDYAALHKKLEGTLPALPKQTDPKIIDQHERALPRRHPGLDGAAAGTAEPAQAARGHGVSFRPAESNPVRSACAHHPGLGAAGLQVERVPTV
jgi:hypothetical protein